MSMFHLLVKWDGWSQARDSIACERVFEYTDDAIVALFNPGGILDAERIRSLPVLFVSETNGTGDQRARVGSISRARVVGRNVNIEYGLDSAIPAIANSTLQRLSGDLQIDRFEFSRTHWAIKDVDLFQVLLRNQVASPPSPKVFKLSDLEGADEELISVMMPFDARFDKVYAALQDAAKSLNLRCLRVDDIWENDAVIQDIVSLINSSRIVICDCTRRNANVFYEAGIAHTLGRDVILITQNEGDIPFDLRHLRYISYLDNREGRQQLEDRLQKRIQTLLEQPGRPDF
jgi:hypothetical protein